LALVMRTVLGTPDSVLLFGPLASWPPVLVMPFGRIVASPWHAVDPTVPLKLTQPLSVGVACTVKRRGTAPKPCPTAVTLVSRTISADAGEVAKVIAAAATIAATPSRCCLNGAIC